MFPRAILLSVLTLFLSLSCASSPSTSPSAKKEASTAEPSPPTPKVPAKKPSRALANEDDDISANDPDDKDDKDDDPPPAKEPVISVKRSRSKEPVKASSDNTGGADSVSTASNKLGIALFSEQAKEKGNRVLAPSSLSMALGMAYLGAQGTTREQMAASCHFPQGSAFHLGVAPLVKRLTKAKKGVRLTVKNFIEARAGAVAKQYRKDLKQYYSATLKSKGKKGAIILTNTTTFMGQWATAFPKKNSKNRPFTLEGGKRIKVGTMNLKARLKVAASGFYSAVRIPYKNSAWSMVVILPTKPDQMTQLEKALPGILLSGESGKAGLPQGAEERSVDLYLPRFSLKTKEVLNSRLVQLGMKDPFEAGKADFSGIAKGLYIEKVQQGVTIKVTEKGVTAKAQSSVKIVKSAPEMPLTLKVDHPFLFAVIEETSGTILFIGRISNPKKTK